MVGLASPDGPVPAVVTVFVLGIVYVVVLSAWTIARVARQGVDACSRQLARLGRWLPSLHRPA